MKRRLQAKVQTYESKAFDIEVPRQLARICADSQAQPSSQNPRIFT